MIVVDMPESIGTGVFDGGGTTYPSSLPPETEHLTVYNIKDGDARLF